MITMRKGHLPAQLAKLPANTLVVVDEAFMAGEFHLYCLNALQHMRGGLKWLIVGDEGQVGPVENVKGYDYTQHPTWKILAAFQQIQLTNSYRNDEELSALAKRVREGRELSLVSFFPTTSTPTTLINIAWTNITCHYVNDLCMKMHMPKDAALVQFVPALHDDDRTQDVYLFVGLPLLSCKTLKFKGKPALPSDASYTDKLRALVDMQNNEAQDVKEVTNTSFTTVSRRNGKERVWELSALHEKFRVGYCFTVHKAQGDTIEDDYTIWEEEGMDCKLKYTAVTRAKSKNQIKLGLLPTGYVQRLKSKILQNLEKKLQQYRANDKAEGRPVCNISPSTFWRLIQDSGSACKHCGEGVKLRGYTKHDMKQVTLDRKDNLGGHTHGIVVISCAACNQCHRFEED